MVEPEAYLSPITWNVVFLVAIRNEVYGRFFEVPKASWARDADG
jgi:hypothetical protein